MSEDGSWSRRELIKTTGAASLAAVTGTASAAVDAGDAKDGTDVTGDPERLEKNLDGVVGSDYRKREQYLYFVEYASGTLSRLDLGPLAAQTVASGTATIDGTYTFDFDSGKMDSNGESDVWWRIIREGERQLEAWQGTITRVEDEYEDLEPGTLPTLEYTDEPIDGSTGTDELVEGSVFAVKTSEGNYAKARVVSLGYDLKIEFETYNVDQYSVLGTGYDRPEDVVISSDGHWAYVTERGGTLLRVPVRNADRSNATEIVSGLDRPHQIALDEDRDYAYLVEYAAPGRLLRVDLTAGTTTTLFDGLDGAVGLVVDTEESTAYVSEQRNLGPSIELPDEFGQDLGPFGDTGPAVAPDEFSAGVGDDAFDSDGELDTSDAGQVDSQNTDSGSGVLSRIDLTAGTREVIVENLVSPFFLTWADEDEDAIIFTEWNPANRVSRLDLADLTITRLAENVPYRPASVAVRSPDEVLICSDAVISLLDLIEDLFGSSPPLLMGIGHIPVGDVSNGLADTTGSGASITARDAPFGGTLPVMLNHEDARQDYGAGYYKVTIDGSEPRQSFETLRYSVWAGRMETVSVEPDKNGFYELHGPNELWYNPRLGYKLNTRGFADGNHQLTVEFYSRPDPSALVASESVTLRFDNKKPRADIGDLFHQTPDGEEVVGACSIVDTKTDEFDIETTAQDVAGHLRNWRLVAHWGDGKSERIDGDHYTNHSGGRSWSGINSQRVSWSATEHQCAHTLKLRVADRTTNGYNHIHRSVDRTSFTLMLPE